MVNMVGTAQSNQMGANVKVIVDKMKVGTYKSCCWQHNIKHLVYAAWVGNAIVKTLSNCHGAISLDTENGVMGRGKDKNGSREMRQKTVQCPVQTKTYCTTFYLIRQGDWEGGQIRHGWGKWVQQFGAKIGLLDVQQGDEQHVCCIHTFGEQGGWESVTNGQSGEGIGARLMPTERAHPENGNNSSISSARYGLS